MTDAPAAKAPCMVRIVVSEPDGSVVHDRTADYNYRDFRQWIDSTQWWAAKNGKTLVMSPPE